jgi:DNA-binding transcriptional regulator YiaG
VLAAGSRASGAAHSTGSQPAVFKSLIIPASQDGEESIMNYPAPVEWTLARIRQFRETALCLSQDEFAAVLGFAKRTVGNAERGTPRRAWQVNALPPTRQSEHSVVLVGPSLFDRVR